MLEQLFEKILHGKRQDILRNIGPFPRNNPVASDIGSCTREMALSIIHWQQRPPFSEAVSDRLQAGKDAEPMATSKLLRYGINVVEQQQMFELKDKKGRLILRGKIDGKIEWDGRRIPYDYKTIHPNIFPRMNTLDDLLNHNFFQKWPKQLWAYEYMNNIDIGFLFLDNLLGAWKFIEVPLDWQRMEGILQQCEDAVEQAEQAKANPSADLWLPFHDDASICVRCWAYGRVCFPPMQYEGMEQLSPEDVDRLDPMLNRMEELSEAADEHDAIEKAVKEEMKRRGIKQAIVGGWLIQGKEIVTHRKSQEAKDLVSWRTTITRMGND